MSPPAELWAEAKSVMPRKRAPADNQRLFFLGDGFGRWGILLSLNFSRQLGIHCRRSAQRGFRRNFILFAELGKEWILPRHVTRHHARGPVNLFNHRAWIGRNLLVESQMILAAAYHRFRQIDRIVSDRNPGQVIPAPYPILSKRRLNPGGNGVAPVIVLLEVSRGDFQHLPDKLSG